MFEYLMPQLLMRSFQGTLLDQSCRMSVRRQIEYGRQRDVAWGISESAYAFTDREGNYQYRAFGVPGLGLKRGLATDLVIAPYASALASLVTPAAAAENFERLAAIGLEGRFGFFEALDYNPRSREIESAPDSKTRPAVVRAYFAHHDLFAHWRHHTGHAIGLRYHEGPFLDSGDATEIRTGMVFTVEPGLYSPELGGFRHSDTVLVTDDGIEILTYYPRDLASLTIPV